MIIQTNEPMVKYSNQVHTTNDYFLFKPIDGNRNKNLLHLNRLRESMKENYLFTIITVNEKYEIIDGQHRFEIIKELDLPLNYVVCKGYGLNEVHILNRNSKTWNAEDYLMGYCNLGYDDYITFAEFKLKYCLDYQTTICLLKGVQNSKNVTEEFYKGEFRVNNLRQAEKNIEKILLIEPYYANVRRRSFIYAMLSLFKNKNFEFTEFLQKLKLQPTALQDCTNGDNYKILIEEIYNYRRRDKVNLRY